MMENILRHLPAEAHYYFTKAQIPRALPENELQQRAAGTGLQGQSYPDIREALDAVALRAGKKDLILVCGSVFLAGEVNLHGIRFKPV